MRNLALILALSSCLACPALAADAVSTGLATQNRVVAPHLPARDAFDAGRAADSACLSDAHLSRTAYVPGASDQADRCGQLLSTDTLVTSRRWNQT